MRKTFLAFLVLLLALPLVADEGMWLFNRTPNAIFKQRYGFEPTQAWLDHLQKVVGPIQQRRLRVVRLG